MKIKTRFCPSPTGHMHLGNVRTALFSTLIAKANSGNFLLRIEDTDAERSKPEYTEVLISDLHWLDLVWQEGPNAERGHGPYFQSERLDIYDEYYQKLIDSGIAYPCFCSEEKLKVMRKTQLAAGKPPRYTGECRSLTKAEIQKKLAAGERPVLRFRVPQDQAITFIDFIKGDQIAQTNDIGDFIIRRNNGLPSFMFCNALDDSLMDVTHVVRGEDHLTNTYRQKMILKALELRVPEYGHLSLILGHDGAPLGKRHGSSSLQDLKNDGFLPIAVINYMARLGHAYESNELMSLNELAANFKMESLSKSPAKFDPSQILHWQKLAVQKMEEDTLWQWAGRVVHELVPEDKYELFIRYVMPNVVFPSDAELWAQRFFGELPVFDDERLMIIQGAGAEFFNAALQALGEVGCDAKAMTNEIKAKLGVKGKGLFMPLRVALTGEMYGPELAHIFELLGMEEIQRRLSAAKFDN